MASIFTYDPDPPRVSSPWIQIQDGEDDGARGSGTPNVNHDQSEPELGHLSEYGVTRLEAEPQEGPTEYKLHLLLRPRRAFKSMSTVAKKSDSTGRSKEYCPPKTVVSLSLVQSQSRQQRLQNLTTQLLWRLQQSSPYHASSSKELVLPRLPEDTVDLSIPVKLGRLVSGLEESRGALYEIGVSDDGTLVGLTKDEMNESISTLRVMAASLGCLVEVLRMVDVGECEWVDSTELADNSVQPPPETARHGKLWVAEAFVTPHLGFSADANGTSVSITNHQNKTASGDETSLPNRTNSTTPQLRVTFTGPTTSGKSSLLGTLSTGTLDNGRGKSRLSLLKHRHEVVSGVTSSIAQELIGYKNRQILNYSQTNIETWLDIHNGAEDGRLVFVSDSAGHPRYRRTVLRGLMNWSPHWVVLCIAADGAETACSTAQNVLGIPAAGLDLVKAHLKLCLSLEVPLAIIITKLDLANKDMLGKTMTPVLTTIKAAGRIPKIIQPSQQQPQDVPEVSGQDDEKIRRALATFDESGQFTDLVPIVLTSAVKGSGIGLVHALLENLPLPPEPTSRDYVGMALNPEQPKSIFHIDDTFSLPASYSSTLLPSGQSANPGVVVSGHLRFGRLSVGDKIVVGPFPPEEDERGGATPEDRPSPGSYGLALSHPSSAELARVAMRNAISAAAIAGEWHDAQIISIRNLRLPVMTLEAGQAGSIGVILQASDTEQHDGAGSSQAIDAPLIRRGMVLAIPSKHMADTGLSLQVASGFTAIFRDREVRSLPIGSFVNVYVASVRTAARILRVSRHDGEWDPSATDTDGNDEIFPLNEDNQPSNESVTIDDTAKTEISLELLHHREWIEMGSQVILLEGGSQDKTGLEGFVGKVVEIVD